MSDLTPQDATQSEILRKFEYYEGRGYSGDVRITCPDCSPYRSQKSERCLSVKRTDDGSIVYNCHHCSMSGAIKRKRTERGYKIEHAPIVIPEGGLSEKAVNYLTSRGISKSTATKYGVFSAVKYFRTKSWSGEAEGIGFPYVVDGKTEAAKYRMIDTKSFTQDGAARSFFGIQHVTDGSQPLVICEGECFPGDAEVLTPEGWVPLGAYTGRPVLQVWADGRGEFVNVLGYVGKTTDELIRHETRGWVSVTTPRHKLALVHRTTKQWTKCEAREHVSATYLTPRVTRVDGAGIPLSDDQIALALAVSADAAIDLRRIGGKRYARFGLKKERKINRLRSLLRRLGVAASDTDIANGYRSICFDLPAWVPGRLLPWAWVARATEAQREFILAEMVHWDGNSVPSREQSEYSTKLKHNADWMQAIAHTSGRCSSIIRRSNEHGSWFKVSILHNKTTSSWQGVRTTKIQHEGMVYCVVVPSGMILVRQEDKISVTGNCDVLSMAEAGVKNAVSVPSGAPAEPLRENVSRDSARFGFLARAADIVKLFKKVVIAVDNDQPGRNLSDELTRRIGRHLCYQIEWPDGCKDANDVIREHGKDKLRQLVADAKPLPLAGIQHAMHYATKVHELYAHGLKPGLSTGIPGLDPLFTITPGQMSVVTGLPGSGKSELVDQILVNLARDHDWRFAVWSVENPPHLHISKLAEKYLRMPFRDGPTERMSAYDLDRAMKFIDERFIFMEQADGGSATIESVLERAAAIVMRNGARGLVIDPFNYLDMGSPDRQDLTISDMLTKVRMFALAYETHVWFVAHPKKLLPNREGKLPIPNGNDISGGAAWWAKTDLGYTVHREKGSTRVLVDVWKCRFKWIGSVGEAFVSYDPVTGTYYEDVFQPSDYS